MGTTQDFEKAWSEAPDVALYNALSNSSEINPAALAVVRAEFERRGLPATAPSTGKENRGEGHLAGVPTKSIDVIITIPQGERNYSVLSEIRSDILSGTLTRDATVVSTTRPAGKNKPTTWKGTLPAFCKRNASLSMLYSPVRRHAMLGLGIGIAIGICLWLLADGWAIFSVNQMVGAAVMGIPICALLGMLSASRKEFAFLGNICGLGGFVSAGVTGWTLGLGFYFGAFLAGALLFAFPGMTIGAIVGAIRRPHLPAAPDARRESAPLAIGIPAVIAIAIWTAYIIWALRYAPGILPDFYRHVARI